MPVQIQYLKRRNGRLLITSPEVLKDEDGMPFTSIADYCVACDDDTFFMNLHGDARSAVLGPKDPGTGEPKVLYTMEPNWPFYVLYRG